MFQSSERKNSSCIRGEPPEESWENEENQQNKSVPFITEAETAEPQPSSGFIPPAREGAASSSQVLKIESGPLLIPPIESNTANSTLLTQIQDRSDVDFILSIRDLENQLSEASEERGREKLRAKMYKVSANRTFLPQDRMSQPFLVTQKA